MEWCKLYASLARDRDLRRAGEAATLLFVFGLCYCADEETDGFIPSEDLGDFHLPRVQARAEALVKYGLWEQVSDGYLIPNWKPKQRELYAIMEKRRKDRDRVANKRTVSRDSRTTSRATVAVESREEEIPPNPAEGGEPCAKHQPHRGANCRGCGTNTRAVQKAAKLAAVPDWCGECESAERRMVELDDGRLARCPRCHPNVVAVTA